jgi:sugar lactone lactonase YvrE
MTLKTAILLAGLDFPEGPRWHEGKLWFSDMGTGRVTCVDLDGHAEIIAKVAGTPSGLGWYADGSLLVVSMEDRRLLRMGSSGLQEIADLSAHASFSLNDMVVDRHARAYIGNFGYDFSDPSADPRLAEIVLVMPNGNARVVQNEVAFPNGMIVTPDGRTLVVAESLAARLTAFDIAPDGSLTGRRVWARFDDRGFERFDFERVFPDGICLDADGGIWVASPWGSRDVMRVLEGGEVTHRIKTDTQPFAVMLGGPDRRHLLVCTSDLGNCPAKSRPGTGRIEVVQVDVAGVGLP